MHDCLIAFGSNLGDVRDTYQQSLCLLTDTEGIQDLQAGIPVRTEPVGGSKGQAQFLNAAIRFQTSLSAEDLHQRMTAIEQELGRVRGQRWQARKIDLDLLLYDDLVTDSSQLVIPHPRMTFRRFVLEPAKDIAGDMMHPISRMTIDQLIQHLDRTSRLIVWVTALTPETHQLREQLLANEFLRGWTLKLVDRLEELGSLPRAAKLVILSADFFPQWKMAEMRGPYLLLSPDGSETEQEIIAAAAAMEPARNEPASSPSQMGETSQ